MSDLPPVPPRPDEPARRAAAPEALTVEPVGHGVYRYSVAPHSAWTTADLGRILNSIVESRAEKMRGDEGPPGQQLSPARRA